MSDMRHASLRIMALQVTGMEKSGNGLANLAGALVRDGVPEAAVASTLELADTIRRERGKLLRRLPKIMKGTPLGDYIANTRGMGPAVWLLLGDMPQLSEFDTVGALNKFVGLHVEGGKAVRAQKGKKLGFARTRRSMAIARVAEPCMKARGDHRVAYDRRKARTLETHPPMLKKGEGCKFCDQAYEETRKSRASRDLERERQAVGYDCSHFGGPHWTDGHRHADALRVLAKKMLRDLWRVANDAQPFLGYGGIHQHVNESEHQEAA